MRRFLTTGLLLLSSCALLTNCAYEPRVVEHERVETITLPATLLQDPGVPPVPDTKTATQRTVASYLADMNEALQVCRGQLRAIGQALTPEAPHGK